MKKIKTQSKLKFKFQNPLTSQKGFTLLEVLVALAIVGMVLGTVFGLLAGSKRLAFKALDDIERTVFLRSAINAAQVLKEPDYPESPERYKRSLELSTDEPLEKPERQTRLMRLALEPYRLYDEEKKIEFKSVRLVLLDSAR
jgi:general secretion pathway protein I